MEYKDLTKDELVKLVKSLVRIIENHEIKVPKEIKIKEEQPQTGWWAIHKGL